MTVQAASPVSQRPESPNQTTNTQKTNENNERQHQEESNNAQKECHSTLNELGGNVEKMRACCCQCDDTPPPQPQPATGPVGEGQPRPQPQMPTIRPTPRPSPVINCPPPPSQPSQPSRPGGNQFWNPVIALLIRILMVLQKIQELFQQFLQCCCMRQDQGAGLPRLEEEHNDYHLENSGEKLGAKVSPEGQFIGNQKRGYFGELSPTNLDLVNGDASQAWRK